MVAPSMEEDLPGDALLHRDGPLRTDVLAVGAPLAGDGVHPVDLALNNGAEAADLMADATGGAELWIDEGLGEVVVVLCAALGERSADQVEVGGIDIAVGPGAGAGEGDEGAGYGGLAGASLAAEDEELTHAVPPSISWPRGWRSTAGTLHSLR